MELNLTSTHCEVDTLIYPEQVDILTAWPSDVVKLNIVIEFL